MLFHGIYYTYTGCAGWANQASFPFRSGCYFRLLLLHHDQHHLHRGSIIQPSIEISAAAAAAATVRSGENFLRWFIIPAARWKLKISRSGIPRQDIWHSFTFVHSNAKKMCAYTNEITIVIDILRWKICRNLIFIVWILHSFEIIDRQTRRRWCPLFYCYFIDFFLFYYFLFLVVSRDINCQLTSRSSGPPFFLWPFIVGSQTETIRYAVCAVVAHFWSPSSSKRSSPLFISFVLLIFSVRLIYSSSSSSTFSSFFFFAVAETMKMP